MDSTLNLQVSFFKKIIYNVVCFLMKFIKVLRNFILTRKQK